MPLIDLCGYKQEVKRSYNRQKYFNYHQEDTLKKNFQLALLFLIFQVTLSIWMWAVTRVIPVRIPMSEADLYKGVAGENNPWLEPWQRWDTTHYQAIAIHGYKAFDTALFTPPFYPTAMWLFAPLFLNNELAAGLFISSLSFLGCLIVFHSLSLLEFADEDNAWRVIKYFSFFPTAFFLVAAYSESLYLFCVLLCFYYIKKNSWVWTGIFGGLAAFTRLPGALIIIPLLWVSWHAYKTAGYKVWLAPALATAGAAIFPFYVWIHLKLSPLAIFKAQNERGGYLTLPGKNIFEAALRIIRGQLVWENVMELSFTLFLIVMVILAWKKLPRIYGIYAVTMTLFFLTRFGSPQPLVSMARYTIEVFPIFFILAQWGVDTRANRIITYLSWIGLLLMAGQFAIWGWVG